jgi:serine/threonine protein kinase
VRPFDVNEDVPFSAVVQKELDINTLSNTTLNDDGMKVLYGVRFVKELSARSHKGRWTLQEVVGVGGSGFVVRATDSHLHREVALKIILPSQGTPIFGADEQNRLAREKISMQRVQHPGVVEFHESHYDTSKRIYFMVMEYAAGTSLHDHLHANGRIKTAKLHAISSSLLRALQALHQSNIIHLDIKPQNVMYQESDDGTPSIKIIDFGLARAPSDSAASGYTLDVTMLQTQSQMIAGTFMYMPPEQHEGKALDFRSDVFAIGITLYQLASGRFPQQRVCTTSGDALLELRAWAQQPPPLLTEYDVTESFAHFVAKAIAVDPTGRYQSATEMLAALKALKKTVFISWRMAECKNEVRALQPALEELGIKVTVIGELPGGDLKKAIVTGMQEASLFIIMGTETYGKKTSGKIDTWKEMQDIKESGKPYFLVNMNPESSLMRFKEKLANEIFDLDTVAWHRWATGTPMDPDLPRKVLEKLEGIDPRTSEDRKLPTEEEIVTEYDSTYKQNYFVNKTTGKTGWSREEVVSARRTISEAVSPAGTLGGVADMAHVKREPEEQAKKAGKQVNHELPAEWKVRRSTSQQSYPASHPPSPSSSLRVRLR